MTHFDGCDQQPFGHLAEGSAFVDNVSAPPEVIQSLESMSVNELNHYFKNPREGDVEAIAESLRINGQYRPIVVNLGRKTGRPLEVLAGNHTLKAARRLGWETIKVTTVDVDDTAAARIVAADNRTADLGGYDDEVLAGLLQDIGDLEGTGYDDDFLADLLGDIGDDREGLTDPDEAPAVEEGSTISKTGDVWLLGEHRLAVGDGTDPEVVRRATNGGVVDCYLSDPPYNVDYTGGTKQALKIANDKMSPAEFEAFLLALFEAAVTETKPGGPAYIFHATSAAVEFARAFADAGFENKQTLVWVKDRFVLSRQDHHWQHEAILYGWKPGAAHAWYGGRTLSTIVQDDEPNLGKLTKDELLAIVIEAFGETSVVRHPRPGQNAEHPTMKPVGLLEKLLERSTRPGDLVLDTCAGSGSLLIACYNKHRRAALVELDPHYADVICRRYQEYTGKQPVLDATNEARDFTQRADEAA